MVKVVVVDDSKTIREGLMTLINRAEGHSCVGTFSECNTMLYEIGRLNPDVLLLDIVFSNGQTIKGIREAKLILPDLTILVLTVYEENKLIFDSLCAGASGYIVKKNQSKKIIKSIDDALLGRTPMNTTIALKALDYFNRKKNKGLFSEAEILNKLEEEILDKLIYGYNFKAIADSLGSNIETVRLNIKNIYKKLHFNSGMHPLQKQ